MLTNDENNAWSALITVATGVLRTQKVDLATASHFLACLWTIVQNEILGREFLHWLTQLTKIPQVVEEAKKHKFGMWGLQIFCKIVSRL